MRTTNRTRLTLEALEPRCTPTVGYTFLNAHGVAFSGTTNGANITVDTVGGDISINGSDTGFAWTSVRNGILTADGFGDSFVIDSAATPIRCTGGAGNDTFTIGGTTGFDSIPAAVTVSGGTGVNSLVINDAGGVGSPEYVLSSTSLTRTGAGNVTYATVQSVEVDATNNGVTFSDKNQAAGTAYSISGGTGTNALVGLSGGSDWTVNGTNAGSIGGSFSFTSFSALTGGIGNDTFRFIAGASVASISGNGGSDTLNFAACTSPLAVAVSGNNSGSVSGAVGSFAAVGSIIGGTANDAFTFTSNAAHLSGSVNGGPGGSDTLDFSGYTATDTWVNLSTGAAAGIGGSVINIANVLGGLRNNIITGSATGGNILVGRGGAGFSNVLVGSGGNNILISGFIGDGVSGTNAPSTLDGSADAFDVLIAGNTTQSLANLIAIEAVWQAANTDNFAAYVADLTGTGATYFGGRTLNTSNVSNDGGGAAASTLIGSATMADVDLFFAGSSDTIRNLNTGGVVEHV